MGEKLFGTSGIRRHASFFTDEFIERLAYSLCAQTKAEKIAVGRDARPSSPMLAEKFISCLLRAGKDAVDLGIATTPTVAMASEEYGVGVVITASHNPPEDNGFKFWVEGRAYPLDMEAELEEIFYSLKDLSPAEVSGKAESRDYAPLHIERILSGVGKVERKVKILVDCANGAGAYVTPGLLEKMGCEVVAINTETDGKFAHGLEPTEENLKETCLKVKEYGCEVGVVHDGDADRSAAIDSDGRLVDWDSFLAVLAYGKDLVVTTVDASMRIEKVAGEVIRTPIGDVAVANAVFSEKADFGGEPSGSMIFPEVHLFPDGPLAAAKIAKLVSEERFYEVISGLPSYSVRRLKLFYSKEKSPKDLMEKIKPAVRSDFSDLLDVNELDGIRVSLPGGWFLIRPSGTEPCIRVTAEAEDDQKLEEIISRCKTCLSPFLDVA